MKKLNASSLWQPLATKRQLRELCAEAIQQQVMRGEAPHTQLRNRRRHLQKQLLKRIPRHRSPGQVTHAASMVLAMWGLLNVAAPNLAEAAGDGVFQPTMLSGFDVGYNATPTFADIDGDGDLDAFVGEKLGTVKFYRNTGTAAAPAFSAEVGPLAAFDVGYNATPALADIDGDGDLDAFVGERFGTVKFYRNTGSATAPLFTAEAGPLAAFDVGYNAAPAFADIDGDGDLDAWVGENAGTVKFYRNTGTAAAPIFSAEVGPLPDIGVGRYATPAFADIDGDGDLDALVGEFGGAVKFYRNTGSAAAPAFSAEVGPLAAFDVGYNATPALADIDDDGDLDAFIGENLGTVKFYRNTGTAAVPIFSAEVGPLPDIGVGRYAAPALADIDGDGDLDAFVGEESGTVKFYRNTGTAAVPIFSAEVGPLAAFDVGLKVSPAFADIDGDGDLDAFIGEAFGTVKFYRNTGSAAAPLFTAEAGPLAAFNVGLRATPAFADIDDDGDLDAFVGEFYGTVKFYRNTGSAAAPLFTAEAGPLAAFDVGFNAAPTFADIDGDGDLDAFVGEFYGTVKFYRNTGSAAAPLFTAEAGPLAAFDVGSRATPAFADIDADGDLDAFVGEFYGTVKFFQNVADVTAAAPGGGGGCAVQPNATLDDPLLPLMAMASLLIGWLRRKRL